MKLKINFSSLKLSVKLLHASCKKFGKEYVSLDTSQRNTILCWSRVSYQLAHPIQEKCCWRRPLLQNVFFRYKHSRYICSKNLNLPHKSYLCIQYEATPENSNMYSLVAKNHTHGIAVGNIMLNFLFSDYFIMPKLGGLVPVPGCMCMYVMCASL